MNEPILVAFEKHGTMLYKSALSCLKGRLRYGWYDAKAQARAETIVANEDEETAEYFLFDRRGYEYERVEWVTPL